MSRSNRWTIRNYNATLKAFRSEFGLSQAQARKAYSSMRDRLGRSLFGVDVRKHPRIAKQESTKAEKARRAPRRGKPEKKFKPAPEKKRPITTLNAWVDAYQAEIDSYGPPELEVYEATASYKKGRS